ncbi:MAG: phosphate/phosphite/phosphonate ABC transporter substrate-binding protein [Nitrososphaerota archaeon]
MNASRALVFLSIGIMVGALAAIGATALLQPPQREKVIIAVQPTLSAASVMEQAKPLEKFLEDRLGVDVEIYVPTSYAAVVEAIRRGHAQAAMMSAWPAYLAWKLGGADVALAEVRMVSIGGKLVNSTYYYSYWVVPKDSEVKTLEDLRGKVVALPSPLSTSGYLAPLAKLVEKGLVQVEEGREADPSKFFKVVFTGGYAQAWEALKSGSVDAIVIAGDVPERLYNEVLSNTRVIERQGPIPSHAVVFSKDLREPLRSRLLGALIDLGSEQPDIMKNFVSALFTGFIKTSAEEHLGQLEHYISQTNLKYSERLG